MIFNISFIFIVFEILTNLFISHILSFSYRIVYFRYLFCFILSLLFSSMFIVISFVCLVISPVIICLLIPYQRRFEVCLLSNEETIFLLNRFLIIYTHFISFSCSCLSLFWTSPYFYQCFQHFSSIDYHLMKLWLLFLIK